MKLVKLLEILQGAYDKHKDRPECSNNIEVEIWLGRRCYDVKRIEQFRVKPDVTITLEKEKA